MANSQSGAPKKIRLLVAAHKAMFREGICQLLKSETDLDVIGVAGDGATAISLTRAHTPDVLLLELDLPRMSGLRVLELIGPATSGTRVVLLAATLAPSTIIEALELGARGVLQHDETRDILVKSIRRVADGDYWVPRSLVGDLLSHIEQPDPFQLSTRERQIIALVVDGHKNRAIADTCQIRLDTVKHHLTNIFDKTGASTRVELAVFALHHGLAGLGASGAPEPNQISVCVAAGPTRPARPRYSQPGAVVRPKVPVTFGTSG